VRDVATQGLMSSYWNEPWNADGPWHRATKRKDIRLQPGNAGGRRMRHPYLDHIVYARLPDRTIPFDQDPLRKVDSVVTKTLDSSVVAKYAEAPEDLVIREVWLADELSTLASMFRLFHRYLVDVLPPGQLVGWQPRDLTWKCYFIELLDVQLGDNDAFEFEEIGDERPYLMRARLQVAFKLVREMSAPASLMIGTGL